MRIDSGDIDEFIRVQDTEALVVEFDDSFLAKSPKHAINMDACKSGRIPDVLLCQWEMKLFATIAGPAHTRSNEQLEEQVGYTFSSRTLTDSGQVVESEAAVSRDEAGELHSNLWIVSGQTLDFLM